jgi:hypothetical protein
MRAMLYCIHCNACTSNCVYIDAPVDITPLVRYARQTLIEKGQATPQMWQMREQILAWGNPYQDVQAALFELKDTFEEKPAACRTLVVADAAELAYAPAAAQASLHLLQKFGYGPVTLANQNYLGWELWQYGYYKEALTIAETLVREIKSSRAEVVVTLSPNSAYLLRKVFPDEMGLSVPARVLTMPEAVQARLDQPGKHVIPHSGSKYLVMSCAETYQLQSYAAQAVIEHLGTACVRISTDQPYHRSSFPEGLILDLYPEPDPWLARKIAETAVNKLPDAVVCTTGLARKAIQGACQEIPVVHWAAFVMDLLGMKADRA